MLCQWQKLFLLCVAAWGALTAPLSAQGIVQQRRVPIIGMPGLVENLEQLLPIFSTEVGTVDGLRSLCRRAAGGDRKRRGVQQ